LHNDFSISRHLMGENPRDVGYRVFRSLKKNPQQEQLLTLSHFQRVASDSQPQSDNRDCAQQELSRHRVLR